MTEQSTAKTPTIFRYHVRYYVVSPWGELLWDGNAVISQDKPRPDDEIKQALMDVQTATTLRATAPADCPAGKILIAAVHPA